MLIEDSINEQARRALYEMCNQRIDHVERFMGGEETDNDGREE